MEFEPSANEQKDKKPSSKQGKSRPAPKVQAKEVAESDLSTQSDIFVQNGCFKPDFPFDCQKEFTYSEAKQNA